MVEIDSLTKYYGTTRALNDVSFRVNQGEILGLLGPNGAGKTTTLRILTCYLQPTSGTIRVKDLDVTRNPLEVKRMIGYFPETAPIYSEMIVFDYLSYVAEMRNINGEDREKRSAELCELCNLPAVMHRPVSEISKGYKQRVGLAHAMMSDPEILILDEPTAGLDPNQIVEIRSIIREIGRKKTVILSTHILSEAEATCDRVVIINRGRLAADGTMDSLISPDRRQYEIRLSLLQAECETVKSRLMAIPGVKEVHCASGVEEMDGILLTLSCEKDLRPEIYEKVKQENWIIMEFTKEKMSLENIFRELTQESGGKEAENV